jgi:hypothetical protein
MLGAQFGCSRFDIYGALYLFCCRYHSGQSSRGYRILSRLAIAGYRPGLSIQSNRFESDGQRWLYRHLLKNYRGGFEDATG